MNETRGEPSTQTHHDVGSTFRATFPAANNARAGPTSAEPYIRRVTEIYKDQPPSGLEELRQADQHRTPTAMRQAGGGDHRTKTWRGHRVNDLLIYVSLIVSVIALVGTGYGHNMAKKGGAVKETESGAGTTTTQAERHARFPFLPYWSSLSFHLTHPFILPPKLARVGLMIGLDVTELRNRSRAALEVRDGQWLVAVPTGGNDEEFVKVVYAAEVGESMFMSDVKDLVVKDGGIDLQDVILANASFSQLCTVQRPSPPAETVTSTVTVTTSAATATSNQPRDRVSVKQERIILSKLRAEHDEEVARSRKEWKRKEKEIIKREMDVVAREEEVWRRELWVLEEVRRMSKATRHAVESLVDKDASPLEQTAPTPS